MPWLNRADADWLAELAALFADVFVLEDHAPVGALGDTVLRELAAAGLLEGRVHVFGVEGWPACGTPPEAPRAHGLDGALARGADRGRAAGSRDAVKRIWLVLPDPLPTRVFLDCGIVDRLRSDSRAGSRRLRRRGSRAVALRVGDLPVLSRRASPAPVRARGASPPRRRPFVDDPAGFYRSRSG